MLQKNMPRGDAMMLMAASFVLMAIGLIWFIYDIKACIIGFVAATVFLMGYYQWSPINAVKGK
ncbi:MAG: hypothetical protein KKD39_04025 [Candidatus Altiarchaeota archaeon]|nr:hypothetical protein [Candidatus Altiarchaeota archaeon]